jgi:DNA-binding beta-propeller fold protein YncE
VYYSTNFGYSWSIKTPYGSTGTLLGAYVQNNIVLIGRTSTSMVKVELSTDLLVNLSQIPPTARAYPNGLGISNNGLVLIAINGSTGGYYNVSTNGGANWIEAPLFTNAWGVAMVSDGSTIYVTSNSYAYLKKSINSGVSWSDTGNIFSGAYGYGIAMSSDGQHIYVGAYNKGHYISKSSDYGANFAESLMDTATVGTYYNRVFCSSSGQYVLVTTNAHQRVYVSNDYGVTWTRVLSSITSLHNCFSNAVSNSGKYMVVAHYSGAGEFYYSDDYGVTWTTKTISGLSSNIYSIAVNEI